MGAIHEYLRERNLFLCRVSSKTHCSTHADATTEGKESVCGQVPSATIEELGIHAMCMVIMILHRQSWRQTHRQEKVGGGESMAFGTTNGNADRLSNVVKKVA